MTGCDSVRDPSDDAHTVGAFARGDGAVSEVPEQACVRSANDTFTSTVEGVVERVDRESLWLRSRGSSARSRGQHGDDVGVLHELPASFNLGRLVGRAIRATTVCEQVASERQSRTLTISEDDGRLWLIARTGPVHGVTHTVSAGAPTLHAALSQRPEGPLVIGTSELQWLVPVGQSALLRMPNGALFRALLARREPDGTASYVIADDSLFVERLS